MKKYKDLDNDSEIEAYEYNEHKITIRFKEGREQDYTDETISFFDLDSLKARADSGRGLDDYLKKIETEETER